MLVKLTHGFNLTIQRFSAQITIEEGYIEYGNIENCNIEFEVK